MSHGFTPFVDLLQKLPAWDFTNATLFDAGAGSGELGFYIKALTDTYRVKFKGTPHLIGCDINQNNVRRVGQGVYDDYFLWDLMKMPYTFLWKPPKYVACLLTLEHIQGGKADSLKVLDYLETLSPNLIICVPNGNHLYNHMKEKEFNHYSIWHPKDFTSRGYTVYLLDEIGLGGLSRKIYDVYRSVVGSPPESILAIRDGCATTNE